MTQLEILKSDLQRLRDRWRGRWREVDKNTTHPLYFKWRADKSRGIQLTTLIKQIEINYRPNMEADGEFTEKLFAVSKG